MAAAQWPPPLSGRRRSATGAAQWPPLEFSEGTVSLSASKGKHVTQATSHSETTSNVLADLPAGAQAAPSHRGADADATETAATEYDVARARGGDKEAFARLVRRYQGMVYTLAYNVLGNHADAEDAAQEAFVRAYRKLTSFRASSSFATWLFRVALSAIVDYQRRERRRLSAVETGAEPLERWGDGEAEGIERLAYVRALAALGELAPAQRLPVVLRDLYGFSYKEISRLLDRPLGTVKASVHRSRAVLRDRLGDGEQRQAEGCEQRQAEGREQRQAESREQRQAEGRERGRTGGSGPRQASASEPRQRDDEPHRGDGVGLRPGDRR